MFSPITAIAWVISSATVRPVPRYARPSSLDVAAGRGASAAIAAHELLEGLVAGDEVGLGVDLDQGAGGPGQGMPIRPSPATRPAFLAAAARPFLRSQSIAASRSPPVSASAFLQSIMPAPVCSRSSLTRAR